MTEVPLLTHPGLVHCKWFGAVFVDVEADEAFLVDLTRFVSDQSLVVVVSVSDPFLGRTARENHSPVHRTLATIASGRDWLA